MSSARVFRRYREIRCEGRGKTSPRTLYIRIGVKNTRITCVIHSHSHYAIVEIRGPQQKGAYVRVWILSFHCCGTWNRCSMVHWCKSPNTTHTLLLLHQKKCISAQLPNHLTFFLFYMSSTKFNFRMTGNFLLFCSKVPSIELLQWKQESIVINDEQNITKLSFALPIFVS